MSLTTPSADSTAISVGLALLRVIIGAVFVAHGAQKIFANTIPGTVTAFTSMGVPFASLVAPVVSILEFAGGALLILGLATRPAGILLGCEMIGAIIVVHLPAGPWVSNGGYEFAAALGAAALTLALTGAGKYSLDYLFLRRSSRTIRSL